MPETVWKAYIDLMIGLKEFEKVVDIFTRLLERTKHVKVWISFANFMETH